jgi:tetratricopeptide (TPR) repeat protein
MTFKPPLAALLALLLAAPSLAQNPDNTVDRESNKPKRAQVEQEQAVQTSQEAAKFSADGGVTYEQVLGDPDNVDLNYRYALVQIQRGDLKSASATLERILLINPNLPKVRLLYAVVLLRLDNLVESERELSTVLKGNPPDNIRAEAEQYLKEVKKRQKKTQLSGRLSVGLEYDDNRNSTPAEGKRLFAAIPIQLTGENLRRDDVSQIYMVNVEARRDLGTQRGHELFLNGNYYQAHQVLLKTLNLQAFSLQGGGVYKSRWGDFAPSILWDHIKLAQTSFLRSHGAALRWDKKLSKTTAVWFDVRDVMQSYARTAVVQTAGERNGSMFDATVGADFMVSPKVRVGLSANHGIKHASRHSWAYERDGAALNAVVLLGKGTFALANAGFSLDRYDEPDPQVSPMYRRDSIIRMGATYGAPLSLVHKSLKSVIFTLSYENYWAQSTIINYAYTNNKIMGLLTYKWSLGL